MVNQRTLAGNLGLSVATVSRALGAHPGIPPETRSRILKEAARLGYRLERKEVEPVKARSKIGVVFCALNLHSDAYNSIVIERILQGVAEEARRRSLELDVEIRPPEELPGLFSGKAGALRTSGWKGAVVCGPFDEAVLRRIAELTPCAKVVYYVPGEDIDSIDHDDLASCDELVSRLWGLGHRRIGFLSSGRPTPCVSSRFAGWAAALARRGARPDLSSAIGVFPPSIEMEQAASEAIEAARRGVSAWICLNDYMGYRLIKRFKEAGIECPSDVSVCGFDNFEPFEGLPKMLSVEAPFVEMGVKALETLISRVERGDGEKLRLVLKSRIVEGASVGRAP